MNKKSTFEIWRGAGHPWTSWVKPVVFAGLDDAQPAVGGQGAYRSEHPAWSKLDTTFVSDAPGTAVIVDLDGSDALSFGLALSDRGYRPIVVINGCTDPREVVSLAAVRDTLREGARFPDAFRDGSDVRPAFVLDARRMRPDREMTPGAFDNRWMLFASDLPSVERLRERGIERIVVVQAGTAPQEDLHDVLWRYVSGGITVSLRDRADPREERPFVAVRHPWFRRLFRTVPNKLRRNRDWSFGTVIPEPSQG